MALSLSACRATEAKHDTHRVPESRTVPETEDVCKCMHPTCHELSQARKTRISTRLKPLAKSQQPRTVPIHSTRRRPAVKRQASSPGCRTKRRQWQAPSLDSWTTSMGHRLTHAQGNSRDNIAELVQRFCDLPGCTKTKAGSLEAACYGNEWKARSGS